MRRSKAPQQLVAVREDPLPSGDLPHCRLAHGTGRGSVVPVHGKAGQASTQSWLGPRRRVEALAVRAARPRRSSIRTDCERYPDRGDGMRHKPATSPALTEHQIQKQIVDALRLCGLDVYETTAYRQKGSSGIDKGIPDLLVSVSPLPIYIGVEVKRPGGKFSSSEQREAFHRGHFVVAISLETALTQVAGALLSLTQASSNDASWLRALVRRLETFRDSVDPVREIRKIQ